MVMNTIRASLHLTLPETNTAPENRPSQKETRIQQSIFRCKLLHGFRVPGTSRLGVFVRDFFVIFFVASKGGRIPSINDELGDLVMSEDSGIW